MNHSNVFGGEDMPTIANDDVAGLMALRNYAYDIDQPGPSHDQGGTIPGHESTEPESKAQNQTNTVDIEGGQVVEPEHEQQEHQTTDSNHFEFDDLFNLAGSPDRMCDADLAPKNPQTHNFENAQASSSSEVAYNTNLVQSSQQFRTPQSATTDGNGELKQSPPDYNADLDIENADDRAFYEAFAAYTAGPRVEPSQPYSDQSNMNPGVTQDLQATTGYSTSNAYTSSAPSGQPPGNSAITRPALMTWSLQNDPTRNDGSVEIKDERQNYKDPSDIVTLQFSSSKEANDYRPDRRPMPFDPTIPRTIYERQECVIKLIKAMRSFECATDNWGMIKPFATKKFSDRKIEICCWNILDCCIVRQEAGPFLTPEEEALKNKTRKNKQNFSERFGDMLRILRTRKTVCRHLLDPYYLLQFVDDPNSCLSRVDSNKTLNAKKKQTIDAGKKVIAKRAADDDGAAEDEARRSLASPFSTPKREVLASSSSSNPAYVNQQIPPTVLQHLSQPSVGLHQQSPQTSPMVRLQPQVTQQFASGAQPAYHTYPVGNFEARSSVGFHQDQMCTPGSGVVGNIPHSNMNPTASPIYSNILSPPKSPWDQTYPNVNQSSQYPPKSPSMPSAMPQFPSPSVSSEITAAWQPKSCKPSRKRSADISHRPESPLKKMRH
ncbi:hypothetical protein GTR04_4400 [Trichophyton interdigitale]|uniref:Uncharacterized protein n=1 Tax=Trichophyton interdigitale TaxID=101480 RepID=A0A9P5CUN0_9EURO|nr:hypothetical protein GY632_4033 [Trichophyton interdigitale]KAG5210022.1 hypothetical protein GY631_5206 [Trichophyton interdigitale]KAG8208218.1 hypothetical protein GTR04_4400 [Trichophyton interdigitale]